MLSFFILFAIVAKFIFTDFSINMRIYRVNSCTNFNGIRQDRNTVEQLKQDNAYNLNLPNQRRILNAIDELAKIPGEDNVSFLLDVSQNLRYGTNFDLGKKPYNNWKERLNNAALMSLKLSDKSVQTKLSKKVEQVINAPKILTFEERELLAHKELLLEKINPDDVKNLKNINETKLYRNLNYFLISSEVSLAQKIYILKRLNYMMSDDYKINPQLKDKKTKLLAEILNDIVIDTPESKIPNIKSINQRQHGICAAISICRKALAYEDKANYVDMLLTELDDKDYMEVYDRANLGQHKKVPIPKSPIDYNYAIKKGYRIVDTSAMNWMNVADTAGAFNDIMGTYNAFDKENFGTFDDTHIHRDITDKSGKYQSYFRSCKKSKDAAARCKKRYELQKYNISVKSSKMKEDIEACSLNTKLLRSIISQISPSLDNDDLRKVMNDLLSLCVVNSEQKSKMDETKQKYAFIVNEDDDVKSEKIKNYIGHILTDGVNNKILDEKSLEMVRLIEEINHISANASDAQLRKFLQSKSLFDAAAAYRTMQSFALDIPECLYPMMIKYNIPDNESYLIQNLNSLSKKLRSGKMDPELKEKLFEIFENDINDKKQEQKSVVDGDEILAEIFDEYSDTVKLMLGQLTDDLYAALMYENRKKVLLTKLSAVREEAINADKYEIDSISSKLGMNSDKKILLKTLDKYIETLKDENCSDEQYIDIMNKTGHKSRLMDIKSSFDTVYESLFVNQNPYIIMGFNTINGAPADSPIETTQDLYKVLAESFNNISIFIKSLQDRLQVYSNDGIVLNSADPKYAVLKKLENMGDVPTEKELNSLRDKFDRFYNERYSKEGLKIKFVKLPQNITGFTPMEKEALSKYRNNINAWYAYSSRCLDEVYREMKEPLEALNKEIGVQEGKYWVKENDSGLSDEQVLKIFEHMTDRHYYMEDDIKAGINKIKESPYSGASSTSVLTNEAALHEQYIADVKPTVLSDNGNEKVENIIFHDNTWGVSEHENTWVDKYGFLRTDYSADYGGDAGYITNEKYQNGKLEGNLINKQGRFVPSKIPSKMLKKLNIKDSEEYTFPLIDTIIMSGVSPIAMESVKEIKQILLTNSINYLDDLTTYASEMTQDQLKSKIKNIELAGNNAKKIYKVLLKRIKGDEIFDRGIDSEEKYYKLSPNDKLRLIAEKVAIIKAYDDIPDINTYHIEVKSQKDINTLRGKLRIAARNNFDYIMAKNTDIFNYAAESSRKDAYIYLKEFSKENNINLSANNMTKIINSMKRVKKNDYNGCLEQGIDLMLLNFEKSLKLKTGAPNDKIKEVSAKIREVIKSNLYITEEDVKKEFSSGRNKNIADWIDRIFNPKSDKEFAQVLNSIRNMKTEDFKKNYDSKISDEDMGIKPISGYDIVKTIRSGSKSIRESFINTVFAECYYKDIDESKTRAYYDLDKLSRKLSGGTYIGGIRSFDDIYSDFFNIFKEMTIKKEFDKNKDDAFKKYFVFPAYPEVEISTDEELEESLDTLYEKLSDGIDYILVYKKQDMALKIIGELKKYSDNILPQDGVITEKQYSKISRDLNRLMALKSKDEVFADKVDKWRAYSLSETHNAKELKDYINSLYNQLKMYEKTADGKTMKESEEIVRKNLNTYKKQYIINSFGPEYRSKAINLIDKWIAAKSKAIFVNDYFNSTLDSATSEKAQAISSKYQQNIENADEIFDQFRDLYVKHRLLAAPDKYMKEYLLLCAKDAKHPDNMYNSGTDEDKKALEVLREIYKDTLKALLQKSELLELKNILMKCAEKGNLNVVSDEFKKSTLVLKDGRVVNMGSDEVLNMTVSQMLHEENLDTAAMFLNQLGLSEQVVKLIVKGSSLDAAYKSFNRIQTILKSADSQTIFVQKELEKLGNIDNDPDYEQKIKEFGEKIKQKALKTSFRKGARIFSVVIDHTIQEINDKPNQSKTVLLKANVDLGISALRELVVNYIDKLNQPLENIQVKYNLMNKLLLPDNSEVIDVAQDFVTKCQELIEYENANSKVYPNIQISQGS